MYKPEDFLPENKIKMLKKQGYALFGHSAVKLCHYTKSSIRKGKFCYKNAFYGINSHRCMQMSPANNFCNQDCVFCWRTLGWSKNPWEQTDKAATQVNGDGIPILNSNSGAATATLQSTNTGAAQLTNAAAATATLQSTNAAAVQSTADGASNQKIDEPQEIVQQSIAMQQKLLSGFGGIKDSAQVRADLRAESKAPMHVAISLTGEPTLYPKLPELIEEYRKNGFSTFLVSNGSRPDVLEKCNPTQLYVSLDASDKDMHDKINRPKEKGIWQDLMHTFDIISKKACRTVIRITCIKGMNMCNEDKYAQLIKRASPCFLEVKGYSWLGFSRQRLKEQNVPTFEDVMEFAKKLEAATGYVIRNAVADGRVVLLARPDWKDKSTLIDFNNGI